ncbi:MAG TPA: FAD-dependent oxidoreductase [Candidatus Limnocylindrales bacterium]|nr:FAD-dependent oxidoreductase [Candidatus Limnocylindrales bacterium]
MGYRIGIDLANCINCGICMDVCPVQALDMTRPQRGGVETAGLGRPLPWMMEYPTQVGECVGCSMCVGECPVRVITLDTVPGPTPLAARQGPVNRPTDGPGWVPLSEVTREALKPTRPSPFAPLVAWRTRARPEPWQTWQSMVPAGTPAPIAPCQTACPAGTDAGRYVGLIGAGRYADAYGVAAEVNPFPSVCGWICTAPCEAACRRGVLDEPIAIRTLKRFAVEHGTLPPVTPPEVRRRDRVAIVGGGPAGMSAAWYLARLGYPVTVFEAMPVPGGMMAIGIPPYRLPRDVLQAEIARILSLGVDLRLNAAMGRDFSLSDLEAEGFRAVFLATGAPKSRRLGIPGDELRGVVPATRFLKEVNLGEGTRLAGHVVVVGGGSTAMDAARSALRSGAASVTIAYRRGRAQMPAQAEEVEAAVREGIRIVEGAVPVAVVEGNGATAGLRIEHHEAAPDGEGGGNDGRGWRASGRPDEVLPADTILVAIGEEPDPSILPPGSGIEISGWAGIVADPRTLRTAKAGVFAGGDVVSGPKTIIDAVASGRRAAGRIHEYLSGCADGEAEVLAAVRYRTPPDASLRLDLGAAPRARDRHLDIVELTAPTQLGFDEAAARAEASRCFRCDAINACPSVAVVAGRGPTDRPGLIPEEYPAPIGDRQLPLASSQGGTQ